MLAYEDRICLFADLLGFSSLVKSSEGDGHDKQQHALAKIARAVSILLQPDRDLSQGYSYLQADFRATQFSDSIALSFRVPVTGSSERLEHFAFKVLRWLKQLVERVVEVGMLLRGGLTFGKLVHSEDGHLFGPALVEAHEMESRTAIYPRIIIGDKVIKLLDIGKNRSEETHYMTASVSRDFDGLWFLDYLNHHRLHGLEGNQALQALQFLTSISKLLKEHLSVEHESGVRAKYGWLARHYDESRERWLQKRGGDSRSLDFVSEDLLDGFERLPTFSS